MSSSSSASSSVSTSPLSLKYINRTRAKCSKDNLLSSPVIESLLFLSVLSDLSFSINASDRFKWSILTWPTSAKTFNNDVLAVFVSCSMIVDSAAISSVVSTTCTTSIIELINSFSSLIFRAANVLTVAEAVDFLDFLDPFLGVGADHEHDGVRP
eukprot:CAMPEP_0114439572 /NCGR_PEP_ID=MMETSP0103-20121206/15270_1 /TAXON_ID=37642 ORGANISM="Paraphysomonas imperforata, Strain PA2" /NCGR_SAMPLE_ID=MMETSP0103 /ASSEMBLY_ACC=CAM_ASM_000201 /LENGTH=154 /DNA_ID=CAMNT_0001610343 /DNA_START=65 /DNA_END=529 /DNA_ORIENTATION=+